MQLDLLEREPVSETQPAGETTSSTPTVWPTMGEKFAKLWVDYQATVDDWAARHARLAAEEQKVLWSEHYMAAIKPLDAHDIGKLKEDVASKIRERLTRYAEQMFCPVGGSLTIDRSELAEKFEISWRDCSKFDPAAFWSYLESKYDGAAGENLAWQQAASAVYHAFNLRNKEKVESKGGYVILSRSVWIDDITKKFQNRNKLSYSSQQTIAECCNALKGFATWAERPELKSDLDEFRSHFTFHGYEIESRQKFECGDKGEVVVVTFTKSFEFRIREDLAAQLNLFLGTYLPVGD